MNTLITQDRLDELVRLAWQVPRQWPDDFLMAEVGVYKGGSLKYLADAFPDRRIIGFDTFEGLPIECWQVDEIHNYGDFNDTSFEAVRQLMADGTLVTLKAGLFPNSAVEFEPHIFNFIHVDTDFYLSVKACLEWFWPRLVSGGIMVFDDFDWPNCPGVRRALEEFGQPFHATEAKYQAYIIKP